MDLDLRKIAIEAGVAFGATFIGVFLAQQRADSSRQAAEIKSFNSLYRVMAKDCENALAAIRATRPQERPVYLFSPSFLRFSIHEHAVVLNEIDEDRMTRLLASIAKVDELGNRYGDRAWRFDQTFPIFWNYDPPPKPALTAPEAVKTEYEVKRFEYDQMMDQHQRQLEEVKSLYALYEDQIAATCSIFSEPVQRR